MEEIGKKKGNVFISGFMGTGKSTIARRAAECASITVKDTDAMIEEKAGIPCGEIIRTRGEEAFRRMETEAAAEAGKASGVLLATGGGIVTREENRDSLRQNGLLFHLIRGMDERTIEPGRPLSDSREKWMRLAEKRMPLYESWRDCGIENGDPEAAAEEILKKLKELAPGLNGLRTAKS
jgi:shikimate kinase